MRSAQSKNTPSVPTARLHQPQEIPCALHLTDSSFYPQFQKTNRRAWGYITLLPLKEWSKRSTSLPPKAACSSFNFNVMRTTYYYTVLNITYIVHLYMYIYVSPTWKPDQGTSCFPTNSHPLAAQ